MVQDVVNIGESLQGRADCSGFWGLRGGQRALALSSNEQRLTVKPCETLGQKGLVNDFGGVKQESGATQTKLAAHLLVSLRPRIARRHLGLSCRRTDTQAQLQPVLARCTSAAGAKAPCVCRTWTTQVTRIAWAGYHCTSTGLGKGTSMPGSADCPKAACQVMSLSSQIRQVRSTVAACQEESKVQVPGDAHGTGACLLQVTCFSEGNFACSPLM